MIKIIVCLILMIAAGGVAGYLVGQHRHILRGIVVGTLVSLLIPFLMSFSTVATGQVGIKTSFGKVTGDELTEGIHWHMPWQKVAKMNVKVQTFHIDGLQASTKDMQVVNNVCATVSIQVMPDTALELYSSVGQDYKDIILAPAMQETLKGGFNKFTADEVVNKRGSLINDMEQSLGIKLERYGIKVVSITLDSYNFSDSYNEAIENKVKAEQDALTAQAQLETAKAEAEKKKIEAEGEAEANRIRQETLTDKVLEQMWLEKWNGVLPQVVSDDAMIGIMPGAKD